MSGACVTAQRGLGWKEPRLLLPSSLRPSLLLASSFYLCGQQGSDCRSGCEAVCLYLCVCVFLSVYVCEPG